MQKQSQGGGLERSEIRETGKDKLTKKGSRKERVDHGNQWPSKNKSRKRRQKCKMSKNSTQYPAEE